MLLETPQSHCQTPSTGEPDAGKPPVRFGGRGDINTVVPTPILHPAPTGREFLLPNHKPVLKFPLNHLGFEGAVFGRADCRTVILLKELAYSLESCPGGAPASTVGFQFIEDSSKCLFITWQVIVGRWPACQTAGVPQLLGTDHR